MTKTRPFVLPYEPDYTAHRTSVRQRRNSHMLTCVHMNALCESPSIAPDLPARTDAERVHAAAEGGRAHTR